MRRHLVAILLMVMASAGCTSSPAPETAAQVDRCTTTESGEEPEQSVSLDQSQTAPVSEPPAGISDIAVLVTPPCTTLTIAFGDRSGPIAAVPRGIEVVSEQGITRVALPDSVEATTLAPAARAFWDQGAAVPVVDATRDYVLVADASGRPPAIAVLSDPARLVLEFPSTISTEIITLDDTFIIHEIVESQPGRVDVRGWGAAFEAHAGVGLVDSNNGLVLDGWSVEDHISGTTEFRSIRTGNPGVAWAPFSFTVVATELPAGEYGLFLDACGGQCDPTPHQTVTFTLADNN